MITSTVKTTIRDISVLQARGHVGIMGKGLTHAAYDRLCLNLTHGKSGHHLAIEKRDIPMGKDEEIWAFPGADENQFRVLCRMPESKLYGIIEFTSEFTGMRSRWW